MQTDRMVVYVASSWKNDAAGLLDQAHKVLEEHDVDSYDFRGEARVKWWVGEDAKAQHDFDTGHLYSRVGDNVFSQHTSMLNEVDGLLAVQPHGEDSLLEACYVAMLLRKPVVMVGRRRDVPGVMLGLLEVAGADIFFDAGSDALHRGITLLKRRIIQSRQRSKHVEIL